MRHRISLFYADFDHMVPGMQKARLLGLRILQKSLERKTS